jgi:hypothetical protein
VTLFDRRALPAVFVGIGMALTIGVSFLLVIPIEPVYWLLSILAGLLIGYYANTRAARRRGEWLPILGNGVVSGLATGLTLAALLLGVKALFFNLDNGYPDFNRTDRQGNAIPPACSPGGDCVYQRYLKVHGDQLAAAGISDAEDFGRAYWAQQSEIAGLLVAAATGFGLFGAVAYGATRREA